MALSQHANERLAALRAAGRERPLTMEEMREAIKIMREDRTGAAATSAASKATKSAAKTKKNIDSDDLLSQLDGI
jgi:hypothetical protein